MRIPRAVFSAALFVAGITISSEASTGYEVRGREVTYGRRAYALVFGYTEREKIPQADAATFQILDRLTYAKDAKHAYYEGRAIPQADARSFDILPSTGATREGLYAKDARRVYFQGMPLPDADPATFEIDPRRAGLARDKSRVFLGSVPIPGADPTTFEPVDGDAPIARDRNDYYYGATPVKVRDMKSFQLLDTSGAPGVVWGRDASAFYTGTTATPVDGPKFSDLGSGYTTDGNQVFYKGDPIQNADAASFRVRIYKDDATKGDTYVVARDKRNFYTGGMPTADVADGASFQELGRGYARDSKQVYFLSRVVEGADPATFSAEPVRGVRAPRKDAPVVRDANAYYQAGNRIPAP